MVDIVASNIAIMDRPTYNGIGDSGSYFIPLCMPTIQRWSTEDDIFCGSIDYYGRMLIGSAGQASSLLELAGDAASSSNNTPYLTLTNIVSGDAFFDRKTGIKFRGNDGTSYKDLASIEVSHDTTSSDSMGIMQFNMNSTSDNVLSITSAGYLGIGGQNIPLTKVHIRENDPGVPSRMLLESKYLNYPNADGGVFHEASEIFFAGQLSLTETNNINSNSLAKIVGSNDGIENKPDGRLDFYTNNSTDDNPVLHKRMSITRYGNIGIDIEQPANLLEVAPHIGHFNLTATTMQVGPNTQVQISQNDLPSNPGDISRLVGGSFIVNDRYLHRYPIVSVDSSSNITVSGSIPADSITSNIVSVHYPGLNVVSTNGFIGLGTNTPVSAVDMNGSVSQSIISVDGSSIPSGIFNLDNSHYTVICNANANMTINLPDATTCRGRNYIIKRNNNAGFNTVTIQAFGSQTIDISNTQSVGLLQVYRLQSDGSNWWII